MKTTFVFLIYFMFCAANLFADLNNCGEAKKRTASDVEEGDYFSASLAAAGNVVVAGAPAKDSSGDNAGAAYIFERNANGINAWGEVEKLIASDANTNDHFGGGVAIEGDVIVVGASGKDSVRIDTGAAYIFELNTNGINDWVEVKKSLSLNSNILFRIRVFMSSLDLPNISYTDMPDIP